jgi:Ricin-type beta-trefoil lectin domain-like
LRLTSIFFSISILASLSYGQTTISVPAYPVKIVAQSSGKCIQPSYSSTQTNYPMIQMTCSSDPSQLWTFLPQSDGTYLIQSLHSGLFLFVAGNPPLAGARVVQYPTHSNWKMNWNVGADTIPGNYRVTFAASSNCLDVKGGVSATSNSAAIDQAVCSGLSNQSWQLVDEHNVSLSWQPSTSTGVTGYYVYRGTTATGPFTKLSSALADTDYVDGTVQAGHTYYYVTTATDGSRESSYSNQVQAVIPN